MGIESSCRQFQDLEPSTNPWIRRLTRGAIPTTLGCATVDATGIVHHDSWVKQPHLFTMVDNHTNQVGMHVLSVVSPGNNLRSLDCHQVSSGVFTSGTLMSGTLMSGTLMSGTLMSGTGTLMSGMLGMLTFGTCHRGASKPKQTYNEHQ